MTTHREVLIEHALSYRRALGDAGIVPMRIDGDGNKRPLQKWRKGGGLRQESSIRSRFARADIDESVTLAITTGKRLRDGRYLAAIDADAHKNGPALLAEMGLPETAVSLTPSGGLHALYSTREPVPTANFVNGLELKALRALLTMPPGHGTYWINDLKSIAPLPEWFLHQERLATADRSQHERSAVLEASCDLARIFELDQLRSEVLKLKKGERHEGLMRIAGRAGWLVRSGSLPGQSTFDGLLTAAVQVGLGVDEAAAAIGYCFDNDKRELTLRPSGGVKAGMPTPADLKALRFVYDHLQMRRHDKEPWRHSGVLATRFVGEALGVSHIAAGKRLRRLEAAGLLWPGTPKRLEDGQRRANRYGISKHACRLLNELDPVPRPPTLLELSA